MRTVLLIVIPLLETYVVHTLLGYIGASAVGGSLLSVTSFRGTDSPYVFSEIDILRILFGLQSVTKYGH